MATNILKSKAVLHGHSSLVINQKILNGENISDRF
jgi:hypothetical protein